MKQQVERVFIFVAGLLVMAFVMVSYIGNSPSLVQTYVGVMNEGDIQMHKELTQMRQTVNELKIAKNNTVVYIQKQSTSHGDVDKLVKTGPVVVSDSHSHKNDDHVSEQLYDKVRVLCWIMTYPKNLRRKAIYVKNTWGKRCNKLLFMSEKEDKDFPAVGLGTPPGRDHLTAKTMAAFDYIIKHHFDEADWFMKADDDTYVIVENLRYMLSTHAPTEPVYFGHELTIKNRQGFTSGGAGYVLSKEALRRFSKRDPNACRRDGGPEDVEMGYCLENLGVKIGDSRDKLGRSRFHCFSPETHLHGRYLRWYYVHDRYNAKKGIESMSDYPVSFHYVTPDKMYDLEYYVYHLGAYGIVRGLQDLNAHTSGRSHLLDLFKEAKLDTSVNTTAPTTVTKSDVTSAVTTT